VEHLGPCKKLLRIELDAPKVEEGFAAATREYMRHAKLPGFRPGKVPRSLIEKTFGPRIEQEVEKGLVAEAYEEAMTQEGFRQIRYPDIEKEELTRGQPFRFTATVEIEPVFELPDYKGLPVRAERKQVTDEDVNRAIDMLRQERAQFVRVERLVQSGDYVVVNYTGTCEGKPITDLAPAHRGLAERKNFWLHVRTEYFIPGFTDQLIGANAGEKRTVIVTYPSDFVAQELAGKQGMYEVELVEVKEQVLPAADDEFAKSLGAENLEQVLQGVRKDLENDRKYQERRAMRDQLVSALLGRVNVDLPDALLEHETRNVVYDIVRANQERGVTKEAIDQRKDEIYTVASNSARERVKASILLRRVAEKESLEATPEEMSRRIMQLAMQSGVKPDRLAKQLKERGALGEIRQQVITEKVLDMLEQHAQIQEVPASR
jgi:trigger factor